MLEFLAIFGGVMGVVVGVAFGYPAGRRSRPAGFHCEGCGTFLPVHRVWCGDPCHAPRDTDPGPEPARPEGFPPQAMDRAVEDVMREFLEISAKHGTFNSGHEAYAVLDEEVDELWDEVKRKAGPERAAGIRREAVQVAAVALRIVTEFGDDGVVR